MTTLLAFSGSTRQGSFNTRLINALPALAPAGTQIAFFDATVLPFYNQDLEGDNLPESVKALRAAIREADGVIIATPEYNHTYSALTKNTIDWASRPFGQGDIFGKKSLVIGATPGPGGGVNAIEATVALLTLFGNPIVGSVQVPAVHEKIAADSDTVVDESVAQQLRDALAAF
jgi:chromate reductase